MKKVIFTLAFFSSVLFSTGTFAQACGSSNGCNPTGGPSSGGFEPASATPCAEQGTPYSHAIQFSMFDQFNFQGQQSVDSIQITSIDNLPCGLCWSVNKASKTYAANEDGCISITGTTYNPAGQYKLALALKAWINNNATGLPIPASLVDQTGIKLLIRVNAPQGNCVTADTSAGANNLTAVNCNVGIDDMAADFSSVKLTPNPMNSNGTLSFVSEKTAVYTIRISDATGKVVATKELEATAGVNNTTIDRNGLPAGVYLLQLTDGARVVTNRFSITE